MKNLKLFMLAMMMYIANVSAQTGVTSYSFPVTIAHGRQALKTDAAGNKWIAFWHRGLMKFDGTTWTIFDTTTSGIPSNKVHDIAFDWTGEMWIATDKGLGRYNGTSWTIYNTMNSGLPDDSVGCLLTHGPDVWIGTGNGLAVMNGSSWTVFDTSNSALTTNRIECLNIESSGDLWVGTRRGLCKLSGSTWTNMIPEDPYLENTFHVVSIYTDQFNETWINAKSATLSNIYKVVPGGILPIRSLFPELPGFSPYPDNNFCTGPLGGMMFGSTLSLTEIVGNEIYLYPAPGGNWIDTDPTTGEIWYTNSYSPAGLFSYTPSTPALLSPVSVTRQLDVNRISAKIFHPAILSENSFGPLYEAPKNSNRSLLYTKELWLAGLDASNTLHHSGSRSHMAPNCLPGPLDTITGMPDSAASLAYNRVWKLDRYQIEEFKTMFAAGSVHDSSYTMNPDILSWPAHGVGNHSRNLAPFVDVNGDGLYNPFADGDYPKIKGDQMCFYIYNDNLPGPDNIPLKVEVHASAYAFACDGIEDSLSVLNHATFYSYKIFNRGIDNYHNTFLAIFQDNDLGSAGDDYTGCNPSMNYGFSYNGDDIDDNPPTGQREYGLKPPMASTVILDGPLAAPMDLIDNNNNGSTDEAGEHNLMTHFMYFDNYFGPHGNPQTPADRYNYMNSLWLDSSHVTYGSNGWSGSTPYNFMYDGIPFSTGWDESDIPNIPADRRFIVSCGPFDLASGQNVSFDYAIVYTRDTASTYTMSNLYQKNRDDVSRIQQWFAADSFPSCFPINILAPEIPYEDTRMLLYPNPVADQLSIDYTSASGNYMIRIYDIMGTLVLSTPGEPGLKVISTEGLNSGIYLLNIQDDSSSTTTRFVHH